MNMTEMDATPIVITVREFEDEGDPIILVPTPRLARLIASAVSQAIPNVAAADEAEEARGMVAFIETYLERAEVLKPA